MGAAVGTTTGIGEVVAIVLRLVTGGAPKDTMSFTSLLCANDSGVTLPIAFASTFLLHLLRVGVDMARLGKVAREMLRILSSAVSEAGMVTVVLLVGASH